MCHISTDINATQYLPEKVTKKLPNCLLIFLVDSGVNATRSHHLSPANGILQLHETLL